MANRILKAGASESVKGSAVVDVIIAAAIIVFVILPVFSSVMEKHVLLEKSKIIRDAVDMTNISVYNALNTRSLGQTRVEFSRTEAMDIFKRLLGINLNLDGGLNPGNASVAEGRVSVESLEIYNDGFPVICPGGTRIDKPTVHSLIKIPIRPTLYRSIVLRLLGKDFIDIEVHVDSEIPINN